jgi:hypothetical protein
LKYLGSEGVVCKKNKREIIFSPKFMLSYADKRIQSRTETLGFTREEVPKLFEQVANGRVTRGHGDIVWNIQFTITAPMTTPVRQKYQTVIENGPGDWKVRDSKEVAGG